MNRPEDALAPRGHLAIARRRFNTVAPSLAKGVYLIDPEDALVACEEAVRRFGDTETPGCKVAPAKESFGLNRPEDALALMRYIRR